MKKDLNKYFFWSMVFIFFGVLVRLIHIDLPILEGAITRQIQTASITRNLLENGFDFLHPQTNYLPEPRYYTLEPPLYNSIVASLYLIFGVHEFLGRLVSILFFAGTAFFIFRIASRNINYPTARASVFVFSFTPLSIIFTRAFQPDTTALFFSLACIFYFTEWIKGNEKAYIMACIFGAISFFTKQTLMFILFPLCLYTLRHQRLLIFKNTKFFLFLCFTILPSVLWSFHARSLSQLFPSPGIAGNFEWSNWFDLSIFFQYYFYKTLFQWLSGLILTPFGFVFFFGGLFVKSGKDGDFFLNAWLAGVVVFDLIMHKHAYTHEYYHLPLLPVASIIIGKAWWFFFENIKRSPASLINLKSFRIFGLLLIAGMVYGYTNSGFKLPKSMQEFYLEKEILGKHIEKHDLVITNGIYLYYLDLKGWALPYEPGNYRELVNFWLKENNRLPAYINLVEEWRKQGAVFFFESRPSQFYQLKEFSDYMFANYPIIEQKRDSYILFGLEEKKQSIDSLLENSGDINKHELGNLS